jgi:hypothetical protein
LEKKDELIETVKQLIIRSEGKLTSAQILLENNRIDDAISRAYYAAFLASKALLYLLGISPKTHQGIVTMFGLKVVKEGLLPSTIGRALNELFEARQTSDYAVVVFYTKEDGVHFIEEANVIINGIKNVIRDKFSLEV